MSVAYPRDSNVMRAVTLSLYSFTTYRILLFSFISNFMANYNGKYYIYNNNGYDILKAIKNQG